MDNLMTYIPDRLLQVLCQQYTDGVATVSAAGDIIYISDSVKKILGYTVAEAQKLNVFNITHPDDLCQLTGVMHDLVANHGATIKGYNLRLLHKNGKWRWIQVNATNMLRDPSIGGLVGNFRDVTEQKENEQTIINANRLYNLHAHVSKAIVHINDLTQLFDRICSVTAETGSFRLAWIGKIDETNKIIRLVANSPASETDIAPLKELPYSDDGPVVKLLQGSESWVVNDFSREPLDSGWFRYSFPRGFQSAIALPLKNSGYTTYVFNIFASKPGFFKEEEIRVLQDVAADISFAIDVIEKEKLNQIAENKLRHSELRLTQAQSIAHLGNWEHNVASGLTHWSAELCNIYGIDQTNNEQTYDSWLSFVHPDDLEAVKRTIAEKGAQLRNFSFAHRIVRTDGAIRHLLNHNYFEFNADGAPVLLYGASLDVTAIKEAEEQLMQANRLYSFLSQINQTIVHCRDEMTMLQEACRIAVETGKFKMAWIGKIDETAKTIDMVAGCGLADADKALVSNAHYTPGGIHDFVLSTGTYYVSNDTQNDPRVEGWRHYAIERGCNSAMVLPITKNGRTYGSINLYASEKNFFCETQVGLMREAASDLSFAMEVFENERQRKETDKKMRESIARFDQAQKVAHLGSWTLDFATGIADWSDEALSIYGLPASAGQQTFESWKSFIHPDDLCYVLSIIKESNNSLKSTSFYHRIIRKDGCIRHLHSQAHFEFDTDGQPTGLHGIAHDITEIIEAKEALKQSQANLSMIVDLIPQPIFAKDASGNFISVNKSFASIYGLLPEDMINKNIADVIPESNDANQLIAEDLEVMNNGIITETPELTFNDYSGKTRIFKTTKVPYTLPGRSDKAVLGIALDITDNKVAELERNKVIADLMQRNKDLEQFSYIVSHNLRAPVANIIGLTDLLQEIQNDPTEQEIIIEGLISSGKKLDEVIKDINETLQVKHQVKEHWETVRFSSLLSDIQLSIRNLMQHEDALIIPDFSAVEEMPTLKSYMYSIFFNLISNSIKYRKPGKRPIIEINSSMEGNKACITFKDNGLGIDVAKKGDEIFGLYKRFHHHIGGKGMGLYMVKAQVERMGGKISVESEVNKGTTFKIEFE